jgi:hypothetical protein
MMQCASSFNPTMTTVAQQITDRSLSPRLLPSIGICLSIFLECVVRVERIEQLFFNAHYRFFYQLLSVI